MHRVHLLFKRLTKRLANFKYATSIVLLSGLFVTACAQAESTSSSQSTVESVRAELLKMMPQAVQADIQPTDAQGIFQVEFDGRFNYAYVDGDYILIGGLYNTKQQSNVGAEAKAAYSLEKLKKVPLEEMIVFGPKNPKTYINVFTDVSCGYCRKLHNEVPQLNAAGIEVRYLAWPRAGIGSSDFFKYENVWCSDDQQTALTDAKNNYNRNEQGKPASCNTPVADHFNLGRQLGLGGTPMIFLEDGTLLQGYKTPEQLKQALGLDG